MSLFLNNWRFPFVKVQQENKRPEDVELLLISASQTMARATLEEDELAHLIAQAAIAREHERQQLYGELAKEIRDQYLSRSWKELKHPEILAALYLEALDEIGGEKENLERGAPFPLPYIGDLRESLKEKSYSLPVYVRVLLVISESYMRMGDYEKAAVWANKVVSFSLGDLPYSPLGFGFAYEILGKCHTKGAQYLAAESCLEKCLPTLSVHFGKEAPRITELWCVLSLVRHQLGKFEKAKESYSKCQEVLSTKGTLVDQEFCLEGLGECAFETKNFFEAERLFTQSFVLKQKICKERSPAIFYGYEKLGRVYFRLAEQLDACVERTNYLQKAKEHFVASMRPESPLRGTEGIQTCLMLGSCYYYLCELNLAKRHFERILLLAQSLPPPPEKKLLNIPELIGLLERRITDNYSMFSSAMMRGYKRMEDKERIKELIWRLTQ